MISQHCMHNRLHFATTANNLSKHTCNTARHPPAPCPAGQEVAHTAAHQTAQAASALHQLHMACWSHPARKHLHSTAHRQRGFGYAGNMPAGTSSIQEACMTQQACQGLICQKSKLLTNQHRTCMASLPHSVATATQTAATARAHPFLCCGQQEAHSVQQLRLCWCHYSRCCRPPTCGLLNAVHLSQQCGQQPDTCLSRP
jgi:hypothetical protein